MALQRPDRLRPDVSVRLPQYEEVRLTRDVSKGFSPHSDGMSSPQSKFIRIPSQQRLSLETIQSKNTAPSIRGSTRIEEKSVFLIKNLNTGQVLDLRDECGFDFPEKLSKLTDCEGSLGRIRRLWYKICSEERRKLTLELWNACSRNDVEQVSRLLSMGANPAAKGLFSRTALHITAEDGLSTLCSLLLQHGADPSSRSLTMLKTPLHLAAENGHLEAVRTLGSVADLNEADFEGCTALHLAAKRKDEQMIRLLLTLGANPELEDNDGNASLDLCTDCPFYEILLAHVSPKTYETPTKLAETRASFPNGDGTGSIHYPNAESGNQESPLRTTSALVLPRVALPSESSPTPQSPLASFVSPADFLPIGFLGKGEFGEVFLVKHLPSGKLYAMKAVWKVSANKRNLMTYMQTERNVLSRLDHPFVVRLHWAFQTSSKLFLVVDYCPCGDMNELLQQEKRLSEDRARVYTAEVVLAIESLHEENVIYRDLKPENIVLDEDGHIRLTDFGLAKDGIPQSAVTKSFCGPMAYTAPEMLKQQGHGQTVDWYMLGCLLYEMLVGIPPFRSREPVKLFRKIQLGKLKYPVYMSFEAQDMIQGLLSIDPELRLGTHGAAEIKAHPFFEGVNWDKVYNRELRAPGPRLDLKAVQSLFGRKVYGFSKEDQDEMHVKGWTFSRTD